jgi:2'-hydroxyisoflavone reductase
VTPETYGALKVLCEDIVVDAFGKNHTIVRCGLMVGPHDRSDRFTYCVARCARGGRMLAPAGPDEPMQFIDVRDVAAFVVRALENRTSGVFNVTGLRGTVTFGKLFEHVAGVVNGWPEIVWFDREAIVRSGLEEWKEIPLWINDAKAMRKLHAVVVERALSSGLTLRPLDDTVRDTLAWAQTRPSDYVMKHGMTPEREAEALSASESSASSL